MTSTHLQHPRLALLFAFLYTLLPAAFAQDPILLARSTNGEALYYSVLDVSGSVKRVRTTLVYAAVQTVGDLKNVLASVSLEQIDCLRLTRTTTHVELYDNPDARGTPLWTKDFTETERSLLTVDPAASTASSILFRAVCKIASTSPAVRPLAPAIAPITAASTPVQPPAAVVATIPSTAPQAVSARPDIPTPVSSTIESEPAAAPLKPSTDTSTNVTGAMVEYRPFPELTMTLGMMGKFAEYVYFHEEDYGVLVDTFSKIRRGRDRISLDGKGHPLVDEAYRRIESRTRQYHDSMQEKKDFLSAGQFKRLELPKTQQGAISGFRAELYQHVPSSEKILVFRGTDGALDWLTNAWAGIDFLSIEAPHYQAAYNLVSALRKRGDRPLVVGHSLGGGMAQYVGFKFGLKVVGFNSAPLPNRYFQSGEGTKLNSIRLFSAVEYPERPGPTPSPGYPDPVSIRVANAASLINSLFADYKPIKAHELLTKPICVKSIPEPFYTESERQFHLAMMNNARSKGMVSVVAGSLLPGAKPIAEMVVVAEIKKMVNTGLSDPVWLPDSDSRHDIKIAQAARHEVVEVAVDQYKAIGGAANLMKGSYKVTLGNGWGSRLSGAGSIAAVVAKHVAMDTAITQLLQPHSMARLNRGLRTVSAEDVFSAQPAAADCATTATAKYP